MAYVVCVFFNGIQVMLIATWLYNDRSEVKLGAILVLIVFRFLFGINHCYFDLEKKIFL